MAKIPPRLDESEDGFLGNGDDAAVPVCSTFPWRENGCILLPSRCSKLIGYCKGGYCKGDNDAEAQHTLSSL